MNCSNWPSISRLQDHCKLEHEGRSNCKSWSNRGNNKRIRLLYDVSCVLGRQVPVTTWLHKQAGLWPFCSTVRCVWSAERLLMWACSIQDPSLCQNKPPSPEHTHYKEQVECAAQHLGAKHRLHKHAEKSSADLHKKRHKHRCMVNQTINLFLHKPH